jgi:hypothetical protein
MTTGSRGRRGEQSTLQITRQYIVVDNEDDDDDNDDDDDDDDNTPVWPTYLGCGRPLQLTVRP